METLEIKKDAAIKAHEDAKKSGKKLLENLFGKRTFQRNVTERIQSFDDVLKELGIDPEDFEDDAQSLPSDERAYRQVKLIVRALNEGWVPDWRNSSEYKYFPWFDMDGSAGSGFSFADCARWFSDSTVGSRLCFKSRELAQHAGEQFENIYKEFMLIK